MSYVQRSITIETVLGSIFAKDYHNAFSLWSSAIDFADLPNVKTVLVSIGGVCIFVKRTK